MKASNNLKYRCSDQRGFTLIEVMISAALLLVAIVPMITLMEFSSITQQQSQLSITAANVANEEMEKIKGTPYDNIGTIGSTSIPGIYAAEENIKPPSAVTTTFTITRSISWYPSAAENYSKKVVVTIALADSTRHLASLTNYIGPTGMMPFDEEPAETVPPHNVTVTSPLNNATIDTRNVPLRATADDASPGRMLMVKYFVKNMNITGSSFYGYRLSLYNTDQQPFTYPSSLDSFVTVMPEPPLPDGNYEIYAQAIDLSGNVNNSSVVSFDLLVPPTTPANLYAMPPAGGMPDTSPSVTLMWDPGQSNDKFTYEILRRANKGASWPDSTHYDYFDSTETLGSVYYHDYGIEPNTFYRYIVKTVEYDDSGGPRVYGLSSPASNEAEVRVN